MKLRSLASVGAAVALALVVQTAPASTVHAVDPAAYRITAGESDPDNRGAQQISLWENLDDRLWQQALEEECLENNGPSCEMSKEDIDSILPDIAEVTEDLGEYVEKNPSVVDGIRTPEEKSERDVSRLGAIAREIASNSTDKTLQNLAKTSVPEVVGRFTDEVTKLNTAHDVLNADGAKSVAAVVVSALPVLGDAFSIANALNNKDVESGVIALISLAGTMVAALCAPAGAVIAVGLIVYTVAKKIWGWFCSKDRDWRLEPPGDPEELTSNGANIRWESHDGKAPNGDTEEYALQLTRIPRDAPKDDVSRWAHPKLLLDSRWSDAAKAPTKESTPVEYTVTAVTLNGLQRYYNDVVFSSWQDGKRRDAVCTVTTGPNASGQSIRCELDGDNRITVAENKPALITVDFNYALYESDDVKEDRFCDPVPGPCLPVKSGDYGSVISVESPKDKKHYEVPVKFNYGIIADLPGSKVKHLD